MKLPLLSALALLAGTASAQNIFGVDVRLQQFFASTVGDFVGDFANIAAQANPLFAIDFDETGSALWAVNNTTFQYGTINLGNGVFTASGVVGGITGATGLTCATDGTWYLSEFATPNTNLYVGDVTTGTFSLVGVIVAGIIIDISIDSQGNLYGHNISDDSLYSINTTTGAGTLIGATGQAANFAQGMDFDWSTDTLYATVYTGGGTGVFADFNLATGFANVIQTTTSLNAEMEMAIPPAPGLGTNYCVSAPNSVSVDGSSISAAGSNSIGDADLTLTADNAPTQPALFYFGPNQVNLAFGNGFRCVGGTVTRMPVVIGGGGVFTYAVDFGTFGPVLANLGTANFQCWYRDPAAGGAFFNLSDGLQITFVP